MRPQGKSVTIFMADDDMDDRLMTREDFSDAHLRNNLRFVELPGDSDAS